MNGVVIGFNPTTSMAKVELLHCAERVVYSVSLKGTSARLMPMIVGQHIRFHDVGHSCGSFLSLGATAPMREIPGGELHDTSTATFMGITSLLGDRFHSLSVPMLGITACLPKDIIPSSCLSIIHIGTIVEFVLKRGTIMVESIVSVRESSDVVTHHTQSTAVSATSGVLPNERPNVRQAAAKLNKNQRSEQGTEYGDVVVKQEVVQEVCSDATLQKFSSRVGSQLGTWSIQGFDPAFFFPPELSIRFVHAKMELVNNTPPLVCQGDVLQLQLWSFWVLEGAAMNVRIVDDSGVDVTQHVAKVAILVPDDLPSTNMDELVPQQVCTFEITLLPFHMDETCEIFIEVSAVKAVLLLPTGLTGQDGVSPTTSSPSGDGVPRTEAIDESPGSPGSCVSTTLLSRPIFVRSAAIAKGERSLDEKSLSHMYWVRNVLAPHEHVVSGFIDPGRSNTLVEDTELYESLNLINSEREVLVIDRDDLKLRAILDGAMYVVDKIADSHAKASAILWYVDSVFSAQRFSLFATVARHSKDAADTVPENGPRRVGAAKLRTGVDSRKRSRSLHYPRPSVMRLGDVTEGLCRHRALLFKFLCDAVRVPCYLVRGEHQGPHDKEAERHSWNIVVVGARSVMMVADSTLSPHRLLPWPDAAYKGPVLPSPEQSRDFQVVMIAGGGHRPHVMEECGRGASASVRRCVIGGLTCVVKIPRQEVDVPALRKEFELLCAFSHIPNVVRTFGWYKGIILEHFPLSLLALMNMLLLRRSRLGEGQVKQALVAILTALRHLHEGHFVHRDIKAENVLVNVQRCRSCLQFGTVCKDCSLAQVALADFADCHELSLNGGDVYTCEGLPAVGTAPYAAPEIEHELAFSTPADIWSVGILASEMLLMQLPNRSSNPTGHVAHLPLPRGASAPVFVPGPAAVDPPWAQKLLEKACVVDWRERCTAQQLLDVLGVKAASEEAPADAAQLTKKKKK